MSDERSKERRARRILKEDTAIQRQMRIAKVFGVPANPEQRHRFAKHHALNCGDPNCVMCMNPRKAFGEKTMQERRFDQKEKYDQED